MITTPDAATRATLCYLMGCHAPWYREPQHPVPAEEVGFYQDETERLMHSSSKRDVFVVSIVYAMARRQLMLSASVRSLLQTYEQRKLVCLDCVQKDSFAVWRELETALKLRMTSSSPSKELEKASRSKNEWMKSLTPVELDVIRPPLGASSSASHFRPPWQPKAATASPTTSSTPSTAVASPNIAAAPGSVVEPGEDTASSSSSSCFTVNIHSKCESYDRHQLLFSTYRTLLEKVSAAKAALDASEESITFAQFVRDRDDLFRQFGLDEADREFKAAERCESDRSRIDGGQHEYDTASCGAGRIAEILWENVNNNIMRNHFHHDDATTPAPASPTQEPEQLVTTYAPRCSRLLSHLTKQEMTEFLIGSLCCTWSAVHAKVAAKNLLQSRAALLPAPSSTTSVDDESEDSSAPAVAPTHPKRVKPKMLTLDFSQNRERKLFHRKCRDAGIPHLVMITSAKYRCGTVNGELDVTVMDAIHHELLLVVEAKASAGDLIKARDQKARMALLVEQFQQQQLLQSSLASAVDDTAAIVEPALQFSCAGTVLEWQWDAAKNMLVAKKATSAASQQNSTAASAGGNRNNKRPRGGPASARSPPQRDPPVEVPCAVEGAPPHATGPSIVRIKQEALAALPLPSAYASLGPDHQQRGSIVWFAYCTSMGNNSGSKTPYYSSIAHMVVRTLSSELASALLSPSVAPVDSHSDAQLSGKHIVEQYRATVKARLGSSEKIQDVVGALKVRRITESVRRLWLSEMAKPSSSCLRPPLVLWQELEAVEFRDLILV